MIKHVLFSTITLLLTLNFLRSSPAPDQSYNLADDYRPEFSWDRVPRCLYISGSRLFNEEELDYIAKNFSLITVAIVFAHSNYQNYDRAFKETALALKKRNPNIKILYYWNTVRRIFYYPANQEFDKHPEWILDLGKTKVGDPIRFLQKSTLVPDIDLTIPAVKKWWLDNAKRALDQPFVDGLFCDAVIKIYVAKNSQKLMKVGKWPKYETELYKMYDELIAYNNHHHKKLMIGNVLRERDDVPYERMMSYFHGTFVENHYNEWGTDVDDDHYVKDLEAILDRLQKYAQDGKMLAMFTGRGPDYDVEQFSYQNRLQKMRDNLEYSLALFLIVAEKHSYLSYTDDFRLDTCVWKEDYPEFSKKLGPPLGPAQKDGPVYKRAFEHATVTLDIKKRQASINWSP